MPLLNYITNIDVHKTLGKIQKNLVSHGARKIMYDYDDSGHVQALCFVIDTPYDERGVKLPAANVSAIYEVLKQQKKAGKIKIKLPYMLNSKGQTFFQVYQQKQLTAKEGDL